MELIVSISNWSYFFINIIEIHFLSFFWKRKFYESVMWKIYNSWNLTLIFFLWSRKNSSRRIQEFLSLNVDEGSF